MGFRGVRRAFVLAVLASCALPLSACGGDASFHHGVIGVELPQRGGDEAAWSPDGKWIAVPVKAGIRLRNVASGEVREIEAPMLQGFPVDPGGLSWSGRTLRYVTSDGPREKNVSWLTEVHRDGSGLRQTPLPVKAQSLGWASRGLPLAFATGPYAIDAEKGPVGPRPALYVVDEFGSPARRIVQIPHGTRESAIEEASVSPDGSRVLYERTQRHPEALWTARIDGSAPRRLVSGLQIYGRAVWSPDARKIAFVGLRRHAREGHVYVLPAAGGRPRPVTSGEVLEGPVWTPDGRWLTYSNFDGEIRRVRPDGTGNQVIAEIPDQEIRGLLWSPDGRHFGYTAEDFPPSD